MRLAILLSLALLPACAPRTTVQPAGHAIATSNPAWAYPSPSGCKAIWWLSRSGAWRDWQYGCVGSDAVAGQSGPWGDVLSKDGGASWTAMAWSNEPGGWVAVYAGASLAEAQGAVVGYLEKGGEK